MRGKQVSPPAPFDYVRGKQVSPPAPFRKVQVWESLGSDNSYGRSESGLSSSSESFLSLPLAGRVREGVLLMAQRRMGVR
jgi:hypothetical protein